MVHPMQVRYSLIFQITNVPWLAVFISSDRWHYTLLSKLQVILPLSDNVVPYKCETFSATNITRLCTNYEWRNKSWRLFYSWHCKRKPSHHMEKY